MRSALFAATILIDAKARAKVLAQEVLPKI